MLTDSTFYLDKKESGYVHTKDFISFLNNILGAIQHFSNDELQDFYEFESDYDSMQRKDIISTFKLEELFGNVNDVQSHCELCDS